MDALSFAEWFNRVTGPDGELLWWVLLLGVLAGAGIGWLFSRGVLRVISEVEARRSAQITEAVRAGIVAAREDPPLNRT